MHSLIKIKYLLLLIGLFALASCSQDSNSFVSRNWHNTTAHYNAYFLAKEKMLEVDQQIWSAHKDDYSKVLEVFPPITKETKGPISSSLEDIIKKAALPIKRHRNSKWVDDSYVLVGKARFYGGEYQLAIETFKYVNTKSEEDDTRHQALILLMRTFVDSGSLDNSAAVFDFLKKQKLSKNNERDFYIAQAYFLSKNERYKEMIPYLEAAAPSIKGREKRGRIYFILGQIYQSLDYHKEAYENYTLALKNNPSYELSFFAKLNLAQVSEIANEDEKKRIEKNFKKLLKDLKNVEYRDKIYYEMGLFELKQNKHQEAITYFKKSLRENGKTKNQKARTYLRLGRVYYEDLKKYALASAYYDSTITVWDKKDKDFRAISERQKVLKDFVVQINIIEKEDSLQKLAKMDSTSLNKFIDDLIAKQEQLLKEEKEKQEKAEKNADQNVSSAQSSFSPNGSPIEEPENAGRIWYFYNPTATALGKTEFTKKWGRRPLEDNWRRSVKESVVSENDPENLAKNADGLKKDSAGKGNSKEEEIKVDKSVYLKEIPFTEAQLLASNNKMEGAMYNLGKIYNQKLNEQENAIKTFEDLLVKNPAYEKKAEVMYFLYLIFKEKKDPKEEEYKNRILTEFPSSLYAKIIRNPNYLADSKIENKHIDDLYKKAYNLYDYNKFEEADSAIQSIRKAYPENEIEDKLSLLKVLIIGKTKNPITFKNELIKFIETYPKGPLNDKANELLIATNAHIEDRGKKKFNIDSAGVRYNQDLAKPSYFVAVFPMAQIPKVMVSKFKSFNSQAFRDKKFKTEFINLTDTTFMVIVKEFADKNDGKRYLIAAENDKSLFAEPEQNLKFIITDFNLKLLLKSKNANDYNEFYKENYQ